MKINTKILFVIFPFLTAFIHATVRESPDKTYLLFDAIGFSGRTEDPASTATWRLSSTVADMGSDRSLSNANGYVLISGLWGGAGLWSAASDSEIVFSADPLAKVFIPGGAMPSNYAQSNSTNPAESPIRVSADVVRTSRQNLEAMGNGYTFPVDGRMWELYFQLESGQREKVLLNKPAVLTLSFTDVSPKDGIVDGTEGARPVRVNTLAIWWLDEAHGNWVRLPDPVVNTASGTVTTNIRHFSVFAVMGGPSFDPGDIYAYPVPWRPFGGNSGDGPGQSGSLAEKITFKNLPSECKIRIYTLSGSLVREINHTNGTATEPWDVRSDSGEDVATGTYIWVVDSDRGVKKGKLAVVR